MRKLHLLISIFLLPLSLGLSQERFFLGATGGVSRTSFRGDAPDGASYTSLTGFSAGAICEYAIMSDIRLSIQPSFARRGTKVVYDVGEEDLRDSLKLSLDYFSVPVTARFISSGGAWFVNGGFDCGFLLDATLSDLNTAGTVDVKDFIKGVDLMMTFGVGKAFEVTPGLLTFEVRYAQSLLNAGSSDQIATTAGVPVRFRSSGFQLLVGMLFPL